MNKKNIIFFLGVILIVIAFIINVYSVIKLILACLGILLIITATILTKTRYWYLSIIFVIILIGIDYLKVSMFNLSPVFVIENKINDEVSLYNGVFYRIFKCNNNYIFDNNYQSNYVCSFETLKEVNINSVLSDPKDFYKKNYHDFIKVTGKVSKIIGNNSILLESFTEGDTTLNGYVKFDKNSHLKINLNKEEVNKLHIYDYITIVGELSEYHKSNNELILNNIKIEDNDLYKEYSINIIENNSVELTEYIDELYTYKIDNIILDYKIDKYELSYALNINKITFKEFVNSAIKENNIYKLDKLSIIKCDNQKKILVSAKENVRKLESILCNKS